MRIRENSHGGDTVERCIPPARLGGGVESVARRGVVALAGTIALAAAALAGSTSATAATRSASSTSAQVYVVPGIPGSTLEVLLDDRRIAAAAPPESVVGPVVVPAGQHVLTLRQGGRSVTGARFSVAGGQSVDLVAQRAADRAQTPQVVVFRNDLHQVSPGKGRLVVAHAAVAPPADVRVDGTTLFHDVAPGEALSLLVPARTYSVDVRRSLGSDTILAPVRVSVRAGTLTRVFVVGDPSDGTADAVVQVLPVPVVGAGRPRSVPTGDGGQAATSYVGDEGSPCWRSPGCGPGGACAGPAARPTGRSPC
jgi:hypothetical protein